VVVGVVFLVFVMAMMLLSVIALRCKGKAGENQHQAEKKHEA
jgi:hypothetical protein